IFIVDAKTSNILYVNRQACINLGYTKNELLNLNIITIDPAIGGKIGWTKFVKLLKKKESYLFPGIHKRKNKTRFPVEVNVKYIHGGENNYFIAIARDVTREKYIQEKLQKTLNYLDSIFKNLPVGLAIMEGPEFVYKRINQPLADINGVSIADHIERPLKEVLPQAAKVILPNLRKVRTTGETISNRNIKVTLPSNPQKTLHLIDYHFPIRVGKEIKAIGAVVIDITKQKEAEQKIIEESALKDFFIDVIRHDLLNPMGYVRTMSKMVMEQETNPETKQRLKDIYENSEVMIQVVENARAYSSMKQNEKLSFSKLDLSGIVQSEINILQLLAQQKNMNLRLTMPKKLTVKANPLIKSVFANILHNAIKHGDENTIIGVKLIQNKQKWKFIVINHGPLIPDKDKKDIFVRFKRLIGEGSAKGSGLGLAIVKGVVERHSGEVYVKDYMKKGSKFIVEVPIHPKI
ncbi:hypothetical protein CL622_03900, partial [archaeon]|nr:hypothetical protein [archaeon]